MIYAHSNRNVGMDEATDGESATNFDAFLIDPDFDDALDFEIAALRETLSDSRYF